MNNNFLLHMIVDNIYTETVVKIPIWILESYDFIIQDHEKDSNLN